MTININFNATINILNNNFTVKSVSCNKVMGDDPDSGKGGGNPMKTNKILFT